LDFLIDASLPRDVAKLIASHGHQGVDVRDIGLRCAPDSAIAAYAHDHQMVLVSADFDFGDIRLYPPENHFGVVIIDQSRAIAVADILLLINRFFNQSELLAFLTGRLVIVDDHHIRIRPPLPGK